MSKINYRNWLVGSLPKTTPSNPNNIRTYRIGNKQIIPKDTNKRERKNITEGFIFQLHLSLVERNIELVELNKLKPFPENLDKLIRGFFSEVVKNYEATTLHTASTPPRTLGNAVKLIGTLEAFKKSCINLEKDVPVAPPVTAVLDELSGDVEHYIRSIRITYSSVRVIKNQPILCNRPRQTDAMDAYSKIIFERTREHPQGKFPKPYQVKAQMNALGYVIPERTMRDWAKQMKEGTFGNYVQNRKRQ